MRKRTFAASVVITLATGCKHEPQMTHNPPQPDPDNGNTHNPPEPGYGSPATPPVPDAAPVVADAAVAVADAAAAPVGRTWHVMKKPVAPKKGEKALCDAYENTSCPPPVNGVMVSCNPPRPVVMACPDHLDETGAATIHETNGKCTVDVPCPPNKVCGEQAPAPTACPTY